MARSKPSKRLLIMGQTPPPFHGQAVATQMLFDHDWPEMEVVTLRMAFSGDMDEVGRFGLKKIGHLFKLTRKARKILKENPRTTLFYPPGSASWIPFLRDVVFLLLTRKHAAATVFIHHAGGLAAFVSQSRLRRFLGLMVYGRPDLALEVAHEEIPPREVFRARSWRWCPCAIDVPDMDREIPAEGRPLNVLFVGSLREGKGVLEIIRTAEWLGKRKQERQFKFRVIGRWASSAFREKAEDLVRELGLEEVVTFPGEVTGGQKWEVYREADLFFFPSHYSSEASPIVIMEALGAGLPIVTTQWRGIPKLLDGCSVAAILPVHRPELYGQALLDFLAKREDFPAISHEARRFYEGRFQSHHFLGRIEDSLHKMWGGQEGSFDPPRKSARRSENGGGIRVLQVFNQYHDQGGEEIWVDRMTRLSREDCQMHELRFQSRSWRVKGAPGILRQVRLMWNNPEARHRLRREVEDLEPDVLLLHNLVPVASFGMYEEVKRLGLPVIQYIHNFRPFSPSGTMYYRGEVRDDAMRGVRWREVLGRAWEDSFLKTGLMAYYLKRLDKSGWLKSLTHWIAVSDFMRDRFIEGGIEPSRITTLRHCWFLGESNPPCFDGDYYLFLGRLVSEKGIEVIVKTWDRLEKELGDKCPKLVIAGTGPMERELLHRVAGRDKVEVVGFVSGEAKARYLRGSRAVLAPSLWWEPLGLIVYDAYEYSKPVLAAESGGLTETVKAGEGGLLHPPGDHQKLAEQIKALEQMGPEKRMEMGRTGRTWLEEHASPERWHAEFSAILRKLGIGVGGKKEKKQTSE